MLKHGEVNPLNVHGLRELDHCPPHFTLVTVNYFDYNDRKIRDWIYENLSGRFYQGLVDLREDGAMQRKHQIGFELAGEASFFSLCLPSIKNDNILF